MMNSRGGFDSGDVFWWMVVVEVLLVAALSFVE
jgi:hypothetical protein